MNNSCFFTGHRVIPADKRNEIKKAVMLHCINLIDNCGVTDFIAGGALGFDTLAAQTVLKLKKEYPHIKLILVLPCLSQTKGWREEDIQIYETIKAAADKVVYTSQQYTRDCMHKRNRHLVDHSGVCICYLTESNGGTAYTVNYANKHGLKIINLAE